MTHVVCEACINCKRTDCVDVCPVDCFHEGPNFLAIDPDECIDCAVCVPECPEGAIFAEEDVPADQLDFIQIFLQHLYRRTGLDADTSLTAAAVKPYPDDADEWVNVPNKRQYLKR